MAQGWGQLVEIGRDALVVLVSLSRILEIVSHLIQVIGRVLSPEALLRSAFPPESILFIFGFMLLMTALLWRLVGHPASEARREVQHVRS